MTDSNTTASLASDDGEHITPDKQYLRRRLQTMEPDGFERFVADVWEHLGWQTRVVGEPSDRGIDVIAIDGTDKQLIQAKRYGPDTTVGSPEVQQYTSLRLQEDNVKQVTIITTGEFSRQAQDLVPELEVILVDGENLLGILDELEAYEVFADQFVDIHVGDADSDAGREETAGFVERVRAWFN